MLNNIFQNKLKLFFIFLIVVLLAAVRAFENQLFYDPFLVFFRLDYHNLPFPQYDSLQLVGNIFIRYSLNTILSLALLFVVFRDMSVLKLSVLLYTIFFFVLMFLFFYWLKCIDQGNVVVLFYIRRFLIQPIFILLFVPGFYYQKQFAQN